MIKNKRLSSMFALFSACSLMTVGFTSQAASLQPEVKTAVSTKENIASEIQLNALQAVPANIVTSANSAVDEEVKRAAVLKQSQTLLASIIFCEAGNQPYEGQVAVGAVVMNRVNSGIYPNSIEEVIYQPGQFGPVSTGWLDKVRSSGGYTDSAMQAAADALSGANPVGGCLYFDQGGYGMRIGDHYFH